MIRFLIVDDDALDREAAIRALSDSISREFTLLEAKDGAGALALLNKQNFDCLLLDYRLPDMDGLTLLEKISLQKELDQAKACMEQMALYDTLTSLGNRNLFTSQLERCIEVAGRNRQRFCLLVMDLNRFKKINDTLGHLAGDQVLIEVGSRLQGISRAADMIFRLGGDEFATLLETGASLHGARTLAQKIVAAVKEPTTLGEQVRQVGISIGIALFPDHGLNADSLFNQADAAMYAAKRHGGGFSFAPPWEK